VALHRVTKAVMRSLQLVLLGLVCVLGDPDVFENYFDDELRFVDVSQEVVLKACLANGDDTVKKIQKAYDKCFGQDYSFDDLADTVGRDSDNDDLPDEYEGNEACFYKTMGWVQGKNVQPSVIEADMAGIPDFDGFKREINSCSAWSGNFGGRKKRAVGEAPEVNEEVPSIMETGNGALQWVKSLVRRARNAEPGDGNGGKGKGKAKGGKAGRNKKNGKGGNLRKKNKNRKAGKKNRNGKAGKKNENVGKAGKNNRNRPGKARKGRANKKGGKSRKNKNKGRKNKKDNKGKNKGKGRKNGKKNNKQGTKGKKNRNNKKKDKDAGKDKKGGDKKNKEGRSGKSSDLLPEFVYNQLWCFDLAMEQALEKCVEDKLNN